MKCGIVVDFYSFFSHIECLCVEGASKRDRYQEKSPPKKLKSFFKQSFASQNTTVNKNYWCGLAGGWHHLVSSSYKALPVPSPIRSSFDTQLSNQDKPRIFGIDERHR